MPADKIKPEISCSYLGFFIITMNHYKLALDREREVHDLVAKVNQSRESIKAGKFYSKEFVY